MRARRMKKILILTAGYGEGHNTAARNLCAALKEAEGPHRVDPRVLDLLETTYGRMNDLVKKAYLATIRHVPAVWEKIYEMIDSHSAFADNLAVLAPLRHALEALLLEEQPCAVVSTYPVYNHLIDQIYSDGRPRPFSQITVITDSISINSIWYRCGSDAFVVANEETASVLRNEEVPDQKIHVLGFPVALAFAEMRETRAIPGPGERWRVLYVVNAARKEAPPLVKELLKLDNVDLQVTVGRDAELRAQLEAVIAESGRTAQVHGWTDQLPALIGGAHLVISKAGGATVQETLAARTPLVMTQVVPGQEEGNARLLLENDCGALARSVPEIVAAVQNAFADGGAIWQKWHANTGRLSRPDAARAIGRFILDYSR